MKIDLGFWNQQGEYIPDIQELNEIERKEIMETKNFNEFFDELNDMANFKNFGEKEEEITIDGVDVAGCVRLQDDKISCDLGGECNGWENCYYKQIKRLEQKNFELKESLKCFQTPEAIKALTFYITGEFELQEKKCIKLEQENAELKAYKDVNEDFKKAWEELKAENDRLKALCDTYRTCYQAKHSDIKCLLPKYRTTLKEIKAIISGDYEMLDPQALQEIRSIITKAESEEE